MTAALPVATNLEKVNTITTRGVKSTHDPPYPTKTSKTPATIREEEKEEAEEFGPQAQEMMQDYHDTTLQPFSRRNWKAKMDEQFGKFVDVIQKLYINIPILDAI